MLTKKHNSVVSLLEAILYKEHPYRKHQLWNIVSDTPYTDVTGMMLHIKLKKNHVWKIEIKSHAGVSFLTNPHRQPQMQFKAQRRSNKTTQTSKDGPISM
jgi:dTDP-D-glucose 4,6-dehydratase